LLQFGFVLGWYFSLFFILSTISCVFLLVFDSRVLEPFVEDDDDDELLDEDEDEEDEELPIEMVVLFFAYFHIVAVCQCFGFLL
jgi:hypothetical protein